MYSVFIYDLPKGTRQQFKTGLKRELALYGITPYFKKRKTKYYKLKIDLVYRKERNWHWSGMRNKTHALNRLYNDFSKSNKSKKLYMNQYYLSLFIINNVACRFTKKHVIKARKYGVSLHKRQLRTIKRKNMLHFTHGYMCSQIKNYSTIYKRLKMVEI